MCQTTYLNQTRANRIAEIRRLAQFARNHRGLRARFDRECFASATRALRCCAEWFRAAMHSPLLAD